MRAWIVPAGCTSLEALRLEEAELPTKEGTLYPLLNRMTTDGVLQSVWETENVKGHPRKFYSLTKDGARFLEMMKSEYENEQILRLKLGRQRFAVAGQQS